MDVIITYLNAWGKAFVDFSLSMLIQSSILIVILLLLDLILRKKVRAVFRYGIWMLVLVKLVLPTSLSAPTGLGYWLENPLHKIALQKSSISIRPEADSLAAKPPLPSISTDSPMETSSPTSKMTTPAEESISKSVVTFLPAVPSLTWPAIVLLVWLVVVITLSLLLLQKYFFVRGLIAQARQADNTLVGILQDSGKRLGIRRKVALKLSANTTSPSVCGLFRPLILIPPDLSKHLNAEHIQAVLLHELAHIKRGDLWISFLQGLLQILYFYHPLFWLANAMIRQSREQAVDEMVLVAMGEEAENYPETLVHVFRMAFSRPTLSLRLLGVVESKSSLRRRIKHMVSRPFPKTAKLGLAGFLTVFVTAAVLLPMARAEKEEKTDITEQTLKSAYEVYGTVYDPMPDSLWEDIIAKVAQASSVDEIRQGNDKKKPEYPAVGVVVTLRSGSLTKETVTDAEGKYKFIYLPEGAYSLSCKKTVTSTLTGEERTAVANGDAQLNSRFPIRDHKVDLRLRDDYVTVKGRITDIQGKPVMGAKVTGIEVQDQETPFEPRIYSTISGKDGYYKLEGVEPMNLFYFLPYLVEPNSGLLKYIDIRVESSDLVQNKEDIPRVPLVTQERIVLARRFLKASSQMAQRNGLQVPQESEDLSFPASHGNTITDIDIILENNTAGTQVEIEADIDRKPTADELIEQTSTVETSQKKCEISGRIFEPISHTWWDDFFNKLETAESEDEFKQILMSIENIPEHPAASTRITVQSDSFNAQTTTDAEGRFSFSQLPDDSYTLFYSYVFRSRNGREQEAIEKNNVSFNNRGRARLRLRSNNITVKGRIIDTNGQPVAGAKVIGTKPSWHWIKYFDSPEVAYPVPFLDISKVDGSYELEGINPPDHLFLDVFFYLIEGKSPDTGFLLDIHVEVDGFKENKLQVPLVTDELLYQGRRYLTVFSKFRQKKGFEEYKEKKEFPYPIPSSHDNTITDIDIILERTGADKHPEGWASRGYAESLGGTHPFSASARRTLRQ